MTALRSVFRRFVSILSGPDVSLLLCYAAGLLASRLVGDGAAGQELVGFAGPLAMGVLIRRGAVLQPGDALKLIVIHVMASEGFGDAPAAAAEALTSNLSLIAAGSLVFRRLRRAGFISSQVRVALAVAVASSVGALASAGLDLLAFPGGSFQTAVTHWISATVCSVLVIGVVLTHDRMEDPWGAQEFGLVEPRPAAWEYGVASLLVVLLVLSSIGNGRPEAALAASVALLWFALRLGLFATSLAAFAFTAAMLAFAADGRWPAFLAVADPVEAEILRYLALALLAAPSVVVAAVIHDQKRERRAFAYRALHDGLTKLANRSLFHEALQSASVAAEGSRRRFALFLIDLDHFKTVNDSFGHMRGDTLLVEVASRLRGSVRSTDLVARIGGDEFAVLAPVRTTEDAMKLAKRLVEAVDRPVDLDGVEVSPSITLGAVLAPDSAVDPQRLIVLADEALYAAKAAGRNCWRFSSAASAAAPAQVWASRDALPATETVYLD